MDLAPLKPLVAQYDDTRAKLAEHTDLRQRLTTKRDELAKELQAAHREHSKATHAHRQAGVDALLSESSAPDDAKAKKAITTAWEKVKALEEQLEHAKVALQRVERETEGFERQERSAVYAILRAIDDQVQDRLRENLARLVEEALAPLVSLRELYRVQLREHSTETDSWLERADATLRTYDHGSWTIKTGGLTGRDQLKGIDFDALLQAARDSSGRESQPRRAAG